MKQSYVLYCWNDVLFMIRGPQLIMILMTAKHPSSIQKVHFFIHRPTLFSYRGAVAIFASGMLLSCIKEV